MSEVVKPDNKLSKLMLTVFYDMLFLGVNELRKKAYLYV